MFQFSLHPETYHLGPDHSLRLMLERIWIREHESGDGTINIISGFANFNGGARFYKTLRQHTDDGGQIRVYLGGSTSQRLSSKQVVEALLECGATVKIINRKRILHAKCYGVSSDNDQSLIVSSGNFTGPGMSQNIEASIRVENSALGEQGFYWNELFGSMESQNWHFYEPELHDRTSPAWNLLYDEVGVGVEVEQESLQTLLVLLGHADTARIQARPGTDAAKGTQYFWLSKDCFDFFPPLVIKNNRGWKGTFSAMIHLNYLDIGVEQDVSVSFQAENNLDFRLGTGGLRYSKACSQGDLAAITRIGESSYELRLFASGSTNFGNLEGHAIHFIGHQGKRYGYIDNDDFFPLIT